MKFILVHLHAENVPILINLELVTSIIENDPDVGGTIISCVGDKEGDFYTVREPFSKFADLVTVR